MMEMSKEVYEKSKKWKGILKKEKHVNLKVKEHLRKFFKKRNFILGDYLIIILNCKQYLHITHFQQLESKDR